MRAITVLVVALAVSACEQRPEAALRSKAQAAGDGPDYAVTAVRGAAVTDFGVPVGAEVTICNHGTASGYNVQVLLLVSDDAVITPADLAVSSAFTDPLSPRQCQTLTLRGSVYGAGIRHWGAVVDPSNVIPEQNEGDNTAAGNRLAVGAGPDYVVSAVTGPPNVLPDAPFTSTATVCNRGTRPGESASLGIFLSALGGDVGVGGALIGPLVPGECRDVRVPSLAQVPAPGRYTLGAVVSSFASLPELFEDNDTFTGAELDVGATADLVVTSVSAPRALWPGAVLTARAQVCNQGVGTVSAPVQLTLTRAGMTSLVATGTTGPLSAGRCQTVSLTGTTPGADGVHVLDVVADPAGTIAELRKDNNALAAPPKLNLGHQPDLLVTRLTGPASAQIGQPFTAIATVCNQGPQAAGSSSVELFISPDPSIVPGYFPNPATAWQVGSAMSDFLAPGQCRDVAITGTGWPMTGGAWYLGAGVQSFWLSYDLDPTNNLSATSPIAFGARPDLVVSDVTAPPSVLKGQPLKVSATVCNQGLLAASATPVALQLSADATLASVFIEGPFVDPQLASGTTGALDPGRCERVTLVGAPSVPEGGVYFAGVAVDPPGAWSGPDREWLTADDARTSATRVAVGNLADYVVAAISAPPTTKDIDPFVVNVSVCNLGTNTGASVPVQVLLSREDLPAPSVVGTASTSALAPGQCERLAVSCAAGPLLAGNDGVSAVVDPADALPELREDNNRRTGEVLALGQLPDYVITRLRAPPSAVAGPRYLAVATVCNQGITLGTSVPVGLYQSVDAAITPLGLLGAPESDSPAGQASTPSLQPGECTDVPIQGDTSWGTGAFFLGAVVNERGEYPELRADNDLRAASGRIAIGGGPNYVVTELSGAASVVRNQGLSVSATVCNQGTQPGGSVLLDFLLTPALAVPPPLLPGQVSGTAVGSASVPGLAAGQCSVVTRTVGAVVPVNGLYTLAAAVDRSGAVTELLEDDNARVGPTVAVGTGPDYAVTLLTAPTSVRPLAAPFTTAVKVCNQGTQSGGPLSVVVYLSPDATLTATGWGVPDADRVVGGAGLGVVSPGACPTVNVSTTLGDVPVGGYSLAARVEVVSGAADLNDRNNGLVGPRLGVGNAPDLVVTALTTPATVRYGVPFSGTVRVCNQGTFAGAAPVELYASVDDVLDPSRAPWLYSDTRILTLPVSTLQPGECRTQGYGGAVVPMGFQAPPYFGAFIDPTGVAAELIEDNNGLLGPRLTVVP